MSRPTLTIGIPNHGHARYLPELLDAFLAESYRPLEILIVDDASTDDIVEAVEAHAPQEPLRWRRHALYTPRSWAHSPFRFQGRRLAAREAK